MYIYIFLFLLWLLTVFRCVRGNKHDHIRLWSAMVDSVWPWSTMADHRSWPVFMCLYPYIYVYTWIYNMYMYIYTYIYMYLCIVHMFMYLYMHIYVHNINLFVQMCNTFIYIYIHICIYIYTCVFIYVCCGFSSVLFQQKRKTTRSCILTRGKKRKDGWPWSIMAVRG